MTREGLDEIADLKDAIDYGIVVSDFNKKDLIGPCGEHGENREETNIV